MAEGAIENVMIIPGYEDKSFRVTFNGEFIQKIEQVDPLTGDILADVKDVVILNQVKCEGEKCNGGC